MTPPFDKALSRIFRIFDTDNDGTLRVSDLGLFQVTACTALLEHCWHYCAPLLHTHPLHAFPCGVFVDSHLSHPHNPGITHLLPSRNGPLASSWP